MKDLVAFFVDMVSYGILDQPGTHYVEQVDLKLRNTLVSAFLVLGLKTCTVSHTSPVVFSF